MKKNTLYFSFLILLLSIALASCGQNKSLSDKTNSVKDERKKLSQQDYDSISEEAQTKVEGKIRKVTTAETRNIINSTPVKVGITQEFLPPDKSKWMVEEVSGDNVKKTEIIYIGDAEYRKENGKDWVSINRNPKNQKPDINSDGAGITAKKDESIKDFSIVETKIDNQSYRILTSRTVSSQSSLIMENKIWINSEGLITKEESKGGLGSLTNLLTSSITTYDYEVKNIEIEAPIKS